MRNDRYPLHRYAAMVREQTSCTSPGPYRHRVKNTRVGKVTRTDPGNDRSIVLTSNRGHLRPLQSRRTLDLPRMLPQRNRVKRACVWDYFPCSAGTTFPRENLVNNPHVGSLITATTWQTHAFLRCSML